MDLGVVVGISGIVIAALIAIGVAYYSKPKAELRYSYSVEGLLSDAHSQSNRIRVMYDGEPMTDPHIVRLAVQPTGRSDVGVGTFDDGRPIEFELNTPVVAESLNQFFATEHRFTVGANGTSLEIQPFLIKRRAAGYSASVICNGNPKLEVTDSLRDANIYPWARPRFPAFTAFLGMLTGWTWVVASILTVASWMLPRGNPAQETTYNIFVLSGVALYLIMIVSFILKRILTWKRKVPSSTGR